MGLVMRQYFRDDSSTFYMMRESSIKWASIPTGKPAANIATIEKIYAHIIFDMDSRYSVRQMSKHDPYFIE